jgi:hypothetical protein
MSLDTQTKLAIYRHFAETGQRPPLEVIAERVRADVGTFVRPISDYALSEC